MRCTLPFFLILIKIVAISRMKESSNLCKYLFIYFLIVPVTSMSRPKRGMSFLFRFLKSISWDLLFQALFHIRYYGMCPTILMRTCASTYLAYCFLHISNLVLLFSHYRKIFHTKTLLRIQRYLTRRKTKFRGWIFFYRRPMGPFSFLIRTPK